jgi:hydrogenase maturation protein HypF
MKTYHFHITGQVQGVGFRPFIARLAAESKINGTIKNETDGVHLYANFIDQIECDLFIQKVKNFLPTIARIKDIEVVEKNFIHFDNFDIIPSTKNGIK